MQVLGSIPSASALLKKSAFGFPIKILFVPAQYSNPLTTQPGPIANPSFVL